MRLAQRPLPPHAIPAPAPERELKFRVPEERLALVRQVLGAIGRPDPIHAPARVVTVYYDTPGFDSLDEKVNSDYLKTKIRVRWYEPLAGAPSDDAVFVEGKYRTGAARSKIRVRADANARDLRDRPLEDEGWVRLLAALRSEGVEVPPDVAPVLRLAYVRERFSDPLHGGRLTLDSAISLEAVNTRRLRPGLGGRLSGGVVEHKGTALELPRHLHALLRAGGRKSSFSKYLACYVHATGAVF